MTAKYDDNLNYDRLFEPARAPIGGRPPRLAAPAETARRRTFSAQVKIPDYKRAISLASRLKV